MTSEHVARWEAERRKHQGALRKPMELLRRALSSEDFVDSAVLGGVSVADILAGKVAESQIPPNVSAAFHAQYPQYVGSFVQAVNNLAGHPEKLMGLINGVKGKLFELDYLDWLNHGHLQEGLTAELAPHANNPGWDIIIHDAHGHIAEHLQVKATQSLSYVHEAIAAHPEIDVVVPHELYDRVAGDHDLFAHLLDGHESLGALNAHVADAIGHAEAAGAAEHFPVVGPAIVIAIAGCLSFRDYRKGRVSLADALRSTGERGVLSLLAAGAGWAMKLAVHEPFVGLPTSIAVRLLGGQLLHNWHRRELLAQYIANIQESKGELQAQLLRPLLGDA